MRPHTTHRCYTIATRRYEIPKHIVESNSAAEKLTYSSSFYNMKVFVIVSLYSLVLLSHATQADEKTVEEPLQEPKVTEKSEVVNDAASESEQKDKDYALGSLCNYCSYCKVRI